MRDIGPPAPLSLSAKIYVGTEFSAAYHEERRTAALSASGAGSRRRPRGGWKPPPQPPATRSCGRGGIGWEGLLRMRRRCCGCGGTVRGPVADAACPSWCGRFSFFLQLHPHSALIAIRVHPTKKLKSIPCNGETKASLKLTRNSYTYYIF
jgi:hypothetical protein